MSFTFDEVSEFLIQKPSHVFSQIISGVIDCSSSRYPVVIIDDQKNLKLWTEAVKISFPEKSLRSLAFTELSLDNKGSRLLIIETQNMEEETPDDNVYTRTFDFKNNRFCSISKNYKFAQIAELGFLNSRKLLDSFIELLARFNYNSIGEDIDSFYELFMLITNPKEQCDYDNVRKALDFINKYAEPGSMEDIFMGLEPYMEKIINYSDKQQLQAILSFSVNAAKSINRKLAGESVGRIFYDSIDRILSQEVGCTAEEAYECCSKAVEKENDASRLLFKFFLSNERVSYMDQLMRNNQETERAAFYLRAIEEGLIFLGYSWKQTLAISRMETLLNSCVYNVTKSDCDLRFITQGLDSASDITPRIIMMLFNRLDSMKNIGNLLQAYLQFMDSLKDDERQDIRHKLSGLGGNRLIYEEFVDRLSHAEKKVEFFDEWRKNVFLASQSLSQDFYSMAIRDYLRYFRSPKKLYDQCHRIMESYEQEQQYYDYETALSLVKGIEGAIPLDSSLDKERNFIENTSQLKKAWGIETIPDIMFFADFGIWLESGDAIKYKMDVILDGMPNVGYIQGDRLRHYQDWCIPKLIPLVKSAEDHRGLIYAFCAGDDDVDFYHRYIDFLKLYLEGDKLNGYNAFLQFVVYFFYYLEIKYKLSDEGKDIKAIGRMMKEAIYCQPGIFRKRFDIDVRREFKGRGLSVPASWTKMMQNMPPVSSPSIIKKIKNAFLIINKKKGKKHF